MLLPNCPPNHEILAPDQKATAILNEIKEKCQGISPSTSLGCKEDAHTKPCYSPINWLRTTIIPLSTAKNELDEPWEVVILTSVDDFEINGRQLVAC